MAQLFFVKLIRFVLPFLYQRQDAINVSPVAKPIFGKLGNNPTFGIDQEHVGLGNAIEPVFLLVLEFLVGLLVQNAKGLDHLGIRVG